MSLTGASVFTQTISVQIHRLVLRLVFFKRLHLELDDRHLPPLQPSHNVHEMDVCWEVKRGDNFRTCQNFRLRRSRKAKEEGSDEGSEKFGHGNLRLSVNERCANQLK